MLGPMQLEELQQLMANLDSGAPLRVSRARPKSACVNAAAWKAYGSPQVREAAIAGRRSKGLGDAYAAVSQLKHRSRSGAVSA